ncbi:hypothetical protein RHGRI_024627 [Rhododendron griersonianum]|uniref:RRM domain-containing protein n=1 Tax=Rhododendron griersonianum TaxID=479676 RepID=A0AAV6J7T3_9ERIC|nr:hypothetical protein RHGRI_024627 [Rhododendron griersonianum]
MFTLFVDNIPEEKDHHWLQRTFNNFGVVKDAFIPWKRSKRTGNKFGFVRFDCHVSADMAVSRLNGIWVGNKRLFVKEACFGQEENKKVPRIHERREQEQRNGVSHSQHTIKRANNQARESGLLWSTKGFDKSYAQVVNGESSKQTNPKATLRINSSGNGWLLRSAVAVLRRVVSLVTLKVSFGLEMDKVAQFRALGGRSVLVTFQTQEERNALIKGPWMERWFESAKPWSGDQASYERFAWLGCQGMPLNAWDHSSFKQIGELWGHFISVDEETLRDLSFAQGKILIATEETKKIEQWVHLEVQGVKYEVWVKELSSFLNPNDHALPNSGGHEDSSPVAKVQKKVCHGGGAKGVEQEDDDVAVLASAPTNGKDEVGEGAGGSDPAAAHGKKKKDVRVGGPKRTNSGGHLLLDKGDMQGISEEFESLVEDSVDQLNGLDSNVGLVKDSVDQLNGLNSDVGLAAHSMSPIKAHKSPLVHPKAIDGPVVNMDKEVGCIQGRPSKEGIRPTTSLAVRSSLSESPTESSTNQLEVHSSQIPSINLMVDLNNTECRKRRRRQLSNLIRIREELDREPCSEDISQPSSEDQSQANLMILNEVKASMAVGGELGVNFLPYDDETLRRMIQLEIQEYSLMTEREGGI